MKKKKQTSKVARNDKQEPLFKNELLRQARLMQEVTYDQLKTEKIRNSLTLRQPFLGKDCRVSTLLHVCKRLGVPVASLFTE